MGVGKGNDVGTENVGLGIEKVGTENVGTENVGLGIEKVGTGNVNVGVGKENVGLEKVGSWRASLLSRFTSLAKV